MTDSLFTNGRGKDKIMPSCRQTDAQGWRPNGSRAIFTKMLQMNHKSFMLCLWRTFKKMTLYDIKREKLVERRW